MPSVSVTILLASVAGVHATNAHDATDKFFDQMVDKLLNRGLQAWHQTDLQNTTLEKAAGTLARHGALPAPVLPRMDPYSSTRSLPSFRQLPKRPYGTADSSTKAMMQKQRKCAGTACNAVSPVDCDIESCNAQSEPFKSIDSGERFTATLAGLVQAQKIPEKLQAGLMDLHSSYVGAISKSPVVEDSDKEAAQCIASVAERVLVQFQDPYTFPSRHSRIVEPFDYYAFGQRYIGNLINFETSYIGHAERLQEIQEQLARGENVLLYANHQSEADPAVWAWLTTTVSSSLATDVYYIAGDRVVLDTFAKPFSMGRNLVCVHSKKHMEDDPALKAEKMKTNQKSVRELGTLFKEGGAIVWVAPSGGRDRVGESGEYTPAAFDPAAVMLLKRMMDKGGKPGHVYPMAMASAEIMPPPRSVEKKLGEKRVLEYHGVGISFGKPLDSEAIMSGIDDKAEQAAALTKAAYDEVNSLYKPLADVVYGKVKPGEEFSQPWKS